MTPPRQIDPGQSYFVTVRAVNRSYRFVPKRDVREAVAYCLAVSLAKFRGRIAIHEFLWMSLEQVRVSMRDGTRGAHTEFVGNAAYPRQGTVHY